MAYLLDANVFIQAKNLHYGLDFCPAFWSWLDSNNSNGLVFSIEKVEDEINAGADELAIWAKQRPLGFFQKPDAKLLPALGLVSDWAVSQKYDPAAVNTNKGRETPRQAFQNILYLLYISVGYIE